MRLIDSTLRRCLPGLGVSRRWLRERLGELQVKIPISDGCLQELAFEAESAAWRRVDLPEVRGESYLACLRQELGARARLMWQWTTSDTPLPADDEAHRNFVKIARKYAVPRPWKLSEPAVAISIRARPSYLRWASGEAAIAARALDAGGELAPVSAGPA